MSTSKISSSDISLLRTESPRVSGRNSTTGNNVTTHNQPASILEQATARAASEPAVNMDKVETIRQAIANGDLKIDAGQLAKKMLEFEASIFGTDTE